MKVPVANRLPFRDAAGGIDVAALLWECPMTYRRAAVEACLVGNDTGCFTTEDYRRAYLAGAKCEDGMYPVRLAETHLDASPKLCRPVGPDLWTYPSPQERGAG